MQQVLALKSMPVYIPQSTQQALIGAEQKKMSSMQQTVQQLQLSAAAIPIKGETQQETDDFALQRKQCLDTAASYSSQIQVSQQRLSILQSGSLTMDQMSRFYQ